MAGQKKADFTPEQKLAICERAEELLDGGRRWIKGSWRKKKRIGGKSVDCFCLDGALAQAEIDLGYTPPTKSLNKLDSGRKVSIYDYIRRHWNATESRWRRMYHVHSFNDAPSTTWPDVEKMLQGRIKLLRAQVARRKKKA